MTVHRPWPSSRRHSAGACCRWSAPRRLPTGTLPWPTSTPKALPAMRRLSTSSACRPPTIQRNLEDVREYTTPELFAEIKMNWMEEVSAPQKTDVVPQRRGDRRHRGSRPLHRQRALHRPARAKPRTQRTGTHRRDLAPHQAPYRRRWLGCCRHPASPLRATPPPTARLPARAHPAFRHNFRSQALPRPYAPPLTGPAPPDRPDSAGPLHI